VKSFLPSRYRVSGNPLLTERRVELVASILGILLVLQLVYSVLRVLMLSPPEPLVPAAESLVFSDIKSLQTVSTLQSDEIVARPLFWSSRRPMDAVVVVPDIAAAGATTSELGGVRLTGVFGGGESGGIIAVVDDKKHRVLVGGKLLDWTLDSMGMDHAVFVKRGKTHKLELKTASKDVKTKKRGNKKRKLRL
jgi:hypothetical protein